MNSQLAPRAHGHAGGFTGKLARGHPNHKRACSAASRRAIRILALAECARVLIITRVCIGPERPASRGKSHRIDLDARGIFNQGASLRGLSSTIWSRSFMIAISTFSYFLLLATSRCKLHASQVTSLKSQLDKWWELPTTILRPCNYAKPRWPNRGQQLGAPFAGFRQYLGWGFPGR